MLTGKFPDTLAGDFLAGAVGFLLNQSGKFNFGTARQVGHDGQRSNR